MISQFVPISVHLTSLSLPLAQLPLGKGCEVTLKQYQRLVIVIQCVKSLSGPYTWPNLFHTSA